MKNTIDPHGGKLINRICSGGARDSLLSRVPSMEKLTLDDRAVSDLEMISTGAFSPLTGFLGKADYENVLKENRLQNGCPWTIPITLAVEEDDAGCGLCRNAYGRSR